MVCAFEPSFIRDVVTTLLVSFAEEEKEKEEVERGPEVSRYLRQAILLERDKQGRQTDDKSGLIQLDMYSHVKCSYSPCCYIKI